MKNTGRKLWQTVLLAVALPLLAVYGYVEFAVHEIICIWRED